MQFSSARGINATLKGGLITVSVLALTIACAQNATAQVYESGNTTVNMNADVEVEFDDNIFSSASDEESDFISTLSAGVDFRNRSDTDDVVLRVDGDITRYADNTDQDHEEFRAIGSWAHDVTDRLNVKVSADVRYAVTPRGNTYADPNATPVSGSEGYLGVLGLDADYQILRYTLGAGVGYRFRQYDDTYRRNGALVSNSDRNYGEKFAYIKPGYVFAPNTTAYLKAEISDRGFDDQTISSTRDNNGSLMATGVHYYVPNRLSVDFWVGHQSYRYNSAAYSDTSAVAYNGDIRWTITDDWESRLMLGRDFNSTTSGSTSIIITDTVSWSIGHDLTDDLSLIGEVAYRSRDYKHSGSSADGGDRHDDYYTGKVGAEYTFLDNYTVETSYEHRTRETNAQSLDTSRNMVSVVVKAAF